MIMLSNASGMLLSRMNYIKIKMIICIVLSIIVT